MQYVANYKPRAEARKRLRNFPDSLYARVTNVDCWLNSKTRAIRFGNAWSLSLFVARRNDAVRNVSETIVKRRQDLRLRVRKFIDAESILVFNCCNFDSRFRESTFYDGGFLCILWMHTTFSARWFFFLCKMINNNSLPLLFFVRKNMKLCRVLSRV